MRENSPLCCEILCMKKFYYGNVRLLFRLIYKQRLQVLQYMISIVLAARLAGSVEK